MKTLITSSAFLVLIALTSCNPAAQYEKEIAKIDSCLTIIDSIEIKYNGIEFDSLDYMVKHVLDNEDKIKQYYTPDTISMEIGMRMNECKGIRKTLKGVKSKESKYLLEMEELRSQLLNLKEDISNGVLKKEQIDEYLAQELHDLNILNVSFTDFYEMQKLQKGYFYFSTPAIDSLVEEITKDKSLEQPL